MTAQTYILRTPDIRARVVTVINALNLDDLWSVTIKPYKRNRSLEQNALMWKITTIIGNELGYTKDEMHQETMEMFLAPKSYTGLDGKVREYYSTKGLTVKEMSDFIEHLYQLGAENGILLPVDA